ncbi:DnaJ domain-containing protein [Arthroderma uncinatum]|uniref:DnaJ domain-containing protein n=1 Tax=Arthroderma uncinatum TaxID=74035 RepID=UPI00144A7B98|nr:DnaJ domain-containing protein [Arthroderma uncinatum]KAF3491994.1 DnaJ domain-containing protein [Arthroderma uncinatum]
MPFCPHNPYLRPPPTLFLHRSITRLHISHFSSTVIRAASQTHYETLGVPVSATTDEIKKKFYALSLAHHPDRNKDPSATDKFSSISSAYHVLANPTKRARYDREHDIRIPTAQGATRPGTGSFSSASSGSSQFGSRPASGLSKRRGTFKGPPPSFYANGGYGTSYRQHQQPQDHQQHQHRSHQEHPSSTYPQYHDSDVPHFDAWSHRRTQSYEDMRRRMRRVRFMEEEKKRAAAEGAASGGGYDGGSMTVRFLVISGILVVSMLSASLGRSREKDPGLRELAASQNRSRSSSE